MNESNTTIGAGLVSAMAVALREESGMKVREADAESVIRRLRNHGVEVVYTAQVQQWGEMADCCVYHETGKVCPFCQCERKAAR